MKNALEFIWLFAILSLVTTLAAIVFVVLLSLLVLAVLVVLGLLVIFSPVLALALVIQTIGIAVRGDSGKDEYEAE